VLLQASEIEHEALVTRAEDVAWLSQEIRALAIACQTACQQKISNIVNRCLVEIDPDTKYTFKLIFEEKRNQTEARCVLVDGAGNETAPSNVGGGIQDILVFGLRLACLMLQRPAPARVLILDENFKHLSREYRGPMLKLLESLCADLGLQIILVTHHVEHMSPNANIIEIG
jgi:ABC-type thiamine transport system ATPase subunit